MLRDKILATNDLAIEIVDVPEWGVTVGVRAMTLRERFDIFGPASRGPDGELDPNRLYPAVLITCLVDPEDGTPIFQPEDAEMLLGRSSVVLERLGVMALEVSRVGEAAARAEGNGSSLTASTGSSTS